MIRRHILLLVPLLAFSGCVSVVDMARDLARDLSDIDVAGISGGLLGGETFEMSPEQAAQLKTVPEVRLLWQNGIEESKAMGFMPVFENGAVYAAGLNGFLVRFDPTTGKQAGSVNTKHNLSGGVGAGDGMLLLGTFKGEVLTYGSKDGKALWTAQVSTEVLSPPRAESGTVVVRTGDGRIFSLDAGSGKRKWIYQGATPPLTVRSFAGVLISRGMVFAGFAGGKLVAINLANGGVVWEAVVSRPRGATELERITDVASLPVADEQQICAVAYQGRVACFEIANGNQIWARDASSSAGLAMNDDYIYVSDAQGAVVAYNKKNGTSIWKQDLLSGVQLSPPLIQGTHVVVGDSLGYVNLIRNDTGSIVARSATDGSAITARPVSLPNGFVVQTMKGGLYAFSM
ncbi:outer membrane protein assembly factor BamB [Nitrosospira lacus]|uniref:Outer membrane protein assembly factor BamB n=1 Tax=Nitrosospira lacus TaxID=1288494 RepID=A0A1W6SKK5_9PROT|nr:outer membrane protein assembly factor BamB [Nitrosospira lacus]ARO86332.1 outer membrane protein assembly factor BamB [Nitrosospira lacus]